MNEYTCKDCRHWLDAGREDAVCDAHNMLFRNGTQFCQYFETKDRKRPRFCRLANSVDEMAKEMVFERWFQGEPPEWFFVKDENFNIGGSKHEAIAAAKVWLMEME